MRVEYRGPRGGAAEVTRLLEDAGIEIINTERLPGGGFEKRGAADQATGPLVHAVLTLVWGAGIGAAAEVGRRSMSVVIDSIKSRIESMTGGRGEITVLADDSEVDDE